MRKITRLLLTLFLVAILAVGFAIPSHALFGFLGSEEYYENALENGTIDFTVRPDPLIGDASIDGRIDVRDAQFILHHSTHHPTSGRGCYI